MSEVVTAEDEERHNAGRSTQVPTDCVIAMNGRVSRKMSWDGKSIKFHRGKCGTPTVNTAPQFGVIRPVAPLSGLYLYGGAQTIKPAVPILTQPFQPTGEGLLAVFQQVAPISIFVEQRQ